MSSEIAFEYMVGVLEAVKGTAISVPTHYLNLAGTITPRQERYRPLENRGILAEYYVSKMVKQWAEWEGEGPADVYALPFILEQLVKGAGVIATPGGGVSSRTHTYTPTMTSDDLLSSTLFWGDPNVQVFRSAYCMVDELTLSADASSTDGVTMSVKGQGRFPSKTAPDSTPTMLNSPMLAPADMQVWIDGTGNPIGTTEIADRVVSTEITIPSGVVYKWIATGPTGTRDFYHHGRAKRHAELKMVLELADTTQYDQWVAETALKVRVRFNGPIIEGVLRHYVQVDIYGPWDAPDWGELEGANRTIELNVLSQYDTTATHDFQVIVQNDRAVV